MYMLYLYVPVWLKSLVHARIIMHMCICLLDYAERFLKPKPKLIIYSAAAACFGCCASKQTHTTC